MQTSVLFRWSGIIGILTAILNVIVEVVPDRLGLPLELWVNIFGLGVLAALYLRQRMETGIAGFFAYLIQFIGMATVIGFLFVQAFVLPALEPAQRAEMLAGPTGLITVVGLAITTLGAVLFGVTSLRAGVFPRWAVFLLMLGFVIAPVGGVASAAIKTVGEILLSAGLFGMSYVLLSETTRQTEQVLSS